MITFWYYTKLKDFLEHFAVNKWGTIVFVCFSPIIALRRISLMNIMFTNILYIICSSALIITGLYALFENYKSNSNRSYFAMSFFSALWIIFIQLMYVFEDSVYLSSIFVRLANGMTILVLYFITYFFYYFPKETIKIKKLYQYFFLVYIFILFILTSFTPLVQDNAIINNGVIVSEIYGTLLPIYILTIIGFFIFIILFIKKKLSQLHGIEKTKIKLISICFFLVAFITLFTNILLPQFNILFLIKESVLLSLLFIIPTLYVIQKHRFFQISYVALNVLRLFIFIASLLIIIVAFDQILQYLIPSLPEIYKIILITSLSVFTFIKVNSLFPRFVNKSLRDLRKTISELQHKIYYCDSFKLLIKHLEKAFIENLNIKNVHIYIVRKETDHFEIPIYKNDEFTKTLYDFNKNVLLFPEIDYLNINEKRKHILKTTLQNLDSVLCIPLFAENRLIGFFVLGQKNKGNEYTAEEIKEIYKIKNVLEIGLMNLLLKLNLQEENNLMKEIIEQKTEALRKQFQEIKALLEQQSDFIAVTAHEFRTPLSIALFQLEDTLSSHSHSPQVMQDMEIMNESLNNLKELTQKLFDVQQYDLNKIKLRGEETDIVEFIKQLYSEFSLIMKDKEIKFEFINKMDSSAKLQIDKPQFRQVMNNLLNNAVKFIDTENPLIQMKLEQDGKSTIVSILNTGEPIPDKDKERIFEKFQTTKVTMGTGIGLGLYICKKIIELHNGKIWVTNEKNMTKVSISLGK